MHSVVNCARAFLCYLVNLLEDKLFLRMVQNLWYV